MIQIKNKVCVIHKQLLAVLYIVKNNLNLLQPLSDIVTWNSGEFFPYFAKCVSSWCVKRDRSWVTLSGAVYPFFLQQAFCILLCNLQCHLKWAVEYYRWRLPAWSVTMYTFVHLSLSVCVRTCAFVCVSRLQVIVDRFWQVTRCTPESWSEMTD